MSLKKVGYWITKCKAHYSQQPAMLWSTFTSVLAVKLRTGTKKVMKKSYKKICENIFHMHRLAVSPIYTCKEEN